MSINRILSQAIQNIDEGEIDKAGKALAKVYKTYRKKKDKPVNFVYVQYNFARVYEKKGILSKAEILLKEIIKDNPNHYSAYFLLGKMYEKWTDKENNLKKAEASLSKIPQSATNYDSAKEYLEDVESQISIDKKITFFENKSTEYFNDQKVAQMTMVLSDVDNLDICSCREEYYLRFSEIISRIKRASYQKKRKEGQSLAKISKSNELSTLETILNKLIEKAGFDLEE
jgi:tetratricopeptide (TPR) repeat protein